MNSVREKVDQDLKRIGVVIIDVRLKRVDLPQDVSESVYRRMEAERKRIANELRSTGFAEAERIRADADRQREVILAVAYRDAQRSEEHTSELQSHSDLVCRLLLEKKKPHGSEVKPLRECVWPPRRTC